MDNIKMNKQLGIKWFIFYTKVRPWFACLMLFTAIADFVQYTDVYVSNWWMLLCFVAAVAQPILSVIVAVTSNGDYVDFVRFVKVVLLFETINMAYQQGVKQYINSGYNIISALIMFAIIFVISYFVWCRLNVKYFEKRINAITSDYLEQDKTQMNETKEILNKDKKTPINISEISFISLIVSILLIPVFIVTHIIAENIGIDVAAFYIVNDLIAFFVLPAICIISLIFFAYDKSKKKSNSIRYREKCYKKVAKMKNYLDEGIITEEEYIKIKEEILKNIKT